MQGRDFHTRATTGGATLPLASALCCVAWLAPSGLGWARWSALGVAAVTVYLLVELNNRYALLRVRSRMVGATFLVVLAACPWLHTWRAEWLAPLCLVAALGALLSTYQRPDALRTFRAFALVGVAALVCPLALTLVPALWLSMAVQLRTLRGRTFLASWLGLLLPFWLVAAWGAWSETLTVLGAQWLSGVPALPADGAAWLAAVRTLGTPRLAVTSWLLLLWAVGAVHFLRSAYNDKLRTRMLLYVLLLVEATLWGVMALSPATVDTLLGLQLVASAPIVAHQLTLTRGRLARWWFAAVLALTLALAAFTNLSEWMPSSLS